VLLDEANLRAYARGCAVLGAGGGGDPQIPLIMAQRTVAERGPVSVVPVDELADEALVMPCGLIGAPTVALEKVWSGGESERLRERVEATWGRPVSALMCYEIAGANGLLPLVWAAELGLPLVDADGMGRAFPQMDQLTMSLAGIPASPLVVTDARGNTLVAYAVTNAAAERLARDAVASLGGVAAGALYQMSALDARRAVIRGSVTRALRIGEALSGADDPVAAVVAAVDAIELFEGKVVDVDRKISGGFARGSAVVEGVGENAGQLLRLEVQNEILAALNDGGVVASVPDIITVLDAHSGDAIVTERLCYGQRVRVIAFPSDPAWRTPEGLAVVGPAAFDYDFDYVPLGVPAAALAP
jgi:DUF917 family protein